VRIHSETNRKLGIPSLINNKGHRIVVAFLLIFLSTLLIGYYFVASLPPEGYTTIYALDYQEKKAISYPELLVVNENTTFNVWIVVENHMAKRQSCEVLQKVIGDMIPSFPVDADAENSYAQTVESGEPWETLATVAINKPGSYWVIFELWIYNEANELEFTHNYCVLKVDAVEQT
jgi:uncharacterized membrane protein